MPVLNTAPNMTNPDDFYALLLDAHAGKSTEESSALNAKLILLLANHIGDMNVLREAMLHASKSIKDAAH
jgi:5-carboxymethyl-2-hydroxymuconate isomerase